VLLELEQHLVLTNDDRRAERAECRRGRVVIGQIEDADRSEAPKPTEQWRRVAGDLDDLDVLAGPSVDGRAPSVTSPRASS
jgi:hypothetical protein